MITRGNGRMDIFRSPEDRAKFLQLLIAQKHKLPIYLYAYCLMTNHPAPPPSGKAVLSRDGLKKRGG